MALRFGRKDEEYGTLEDRTNRRPGQENNPLNTDIPMRIPKLVCSGLATAIIAWGSWFYVPNGNEATVTRFGRYVRSEGPGIHLKLPLAETARKFSVTEIVRMEVGYKTIEGTNPPQYEEVAEESQMLTGDENIVQVDLALQTRIVDPIAHQYSLADPLETLRDAAQATVRLHIGNSGIDKALTEGKLELQMAINRSLQDLANQYNMGREITVQLQDVDPPKDVEGAFREVQNAKERREQKVNNAKSYENENLPKARGEAAKMVEQAKGYAATVIGQAEGDRDRFNAILAEYRKAPAITRERIYIEAMQRVYPSLDKRIIDGQKVFPVLGLDQKKE